VEDGERVDWTFDGDEEEVEEEVFVGFEELVETDVEEEEEDFWSDLTGRGLVDVDEEEEEEDGEKDREADDDDEVAD
jgi:hypothetical protein